MKGVNKRVIEINEPDSEYIEKVLVFLRQKDGRVNVARARQEAEGVCQHTCVLAPSAAASTRAEMDCCRGSGAGGAGVAVHSAVLSTGPSPAVGRKIQGIGCPRIERR